MQLTARADQRQKQTQVQRLSQQQIMSLAILAKSSLDLREAIYQEVEKNPALTITRDKFEGGITSAKASASPFSDNGRYQASTAAGAAASDAFQAALESAEDTRETLQEHLSHQYNAIPHTSDETELGMALIHNLDRSGFHILAPLSLLNKKRPQQNEALLKKCMDQIRALDPVGTCCSGVEESLLVQAQLTKKAPRAVLFLLDGHLPFLDPPQGVKILKKIQQFLKEEAKLSFNRAADDFWLSENQRKPFTIAEIEEALAFIRRLDPYPARNFGSSQTLYIMPDVYVERLPPAEAGTATEAGTETGADGGQEQTSPQAAFKITLAQGYLPAVALSPDFAQAAEAKTGGDFVQNAVREAKVFIDSLHFRQSTVARAAAEIVQAQRPFFEKGSRYLQPLRQKDIAEKLGVHEATISRMAKGKYLQCEWGLFDFGYFFTNAVGAGGSGEAAEAAKTEAGQRGNSQSGVRQQGPVSKEAAKYEVSAILKAHAGDKKPLSDQKIADLLAERGIKIARRTVAKYRSELNINSSFER